MEDRASKASRAGGAQQFTENSNILKMEELLLLKARCSRTRIKSILSPKSLFSPKIAFFNQVIPTISARSAFLSYFLLADYDHNLDLVNNSRDKLIKQTGAVNKQISIYLNKRL